MVEYGERLKKLRLRMGVTQEEVEEKTGIKGLWRYETGLIDFRHTTIQRLCEYYGIKLKEFYDDTFI